MVDPSTIISNLHFLSTQAAIKVVKAHGVSNAEESGNSIRGEYLVTLKIVKMWKYRKRWKFRYPSALGNIFFIFMLVTKHIHHQGKRKIGKWNFPTFIMEKCFKARWHLPTVSLYLPDEFMHSRKGIISMITFSWIRRGLSIHAVDRQVNEAFHLTAGHFRFLRCPRVYDVSQYLISFCFIVPVTFSFLMIGLFSRSGDGNAVARS